MAAVIAATQTGNDLTITICPLSTDGKDMCDPNAVENLHRVFVFGKQANDKLTLAAYRTSCAQEALRQCASDPVPVPVASLVGLKL